MRSRGLLKATAIALLICIALAATPAPSLSAEKGIFLSYSTAERLYVDLRHAKSEAASKTKRGDLCNEAQKLGDQLSVIQDAKIKGLSQDKEVYRKEADRLKDLYTKTDQDRVKAENAAPSRLRWFLVGVGTTLAAIIGAFAATR